MKAQIKEMIYNKVQDKNYVSFAELQRHIPENLWKGQNALKIKENLYLWDGMSEDTTDAIKELLDEKKIQVESCESLVYLVDGISLSMPLAKSLKDYKNPRWLPVTLNQVSR